MITAANQRSEYSHAKQRHLILFYGNNTGNPILNQQLLCLQVIYTTLILCLEKEDTVFHQEWFSSPDAKFSCALSLLCFPLAKNPTPKH